MKKTSFLLLFSFISLSINANSPYWGKTGHRATAAIASGYLTPKTEKAIHNILGNKSLALVANYADNIKSNPKYDRFSPWHYINIPKRKTYAQIKAKLGPNIISALKKCKRKLKSKSSSAEERQFYLKMLIHLMGDLHQPMHIGHPDDLGGNKIKVYWFDEPSNLHKVWDENMIDFYRMSYTELALNQEQLSAATIDSIQAGSFVDWMKENRKITRAIYQTVENGDHLSYDYMYHWMPTLRKQLQKGGIRLAKVLNDIFG